MAYSCRSSSLKCNNDLTTDVYGVLKVVSRTGMHHGTETNEQKIFIESTFRSTQLNVIFVCHVCQQLYNEDAHPTPRAAPDNT